MSKVLAVLALIAATVIAVPATATPAGDDGEHKVSVCHATGSESNPWVIITVDEASTQYRAHAVHHAEQDVILNYVVDKADRKDFSVCDDVGGGDPGTGGADVPPDFDPGPIDEG